MSEETTTITVRVPRTLSVALDSLADEIDTSKSQVIRDVLREEIIDPDLADLPEHLVIQSKREQMKRQNRVTDLREGFEGRTRKQLHTRYYSGDYDCESIRRVAENYHREVEILWPEWSETDYQEQRKDMHGFVDDLVAKYQELDDQLGNSEKSLDGGTDKDKLREDAEQLLFEDLKSTGRTQLGDPEEVVQTLSMRPGVDKGTAREVVTELTDDSANAEPTEGVGDD